MAKYRLAEVISPVGEDRMGKQYIEHYVDKDLPDELILGLFYVPKH